MVMHEGVIRPLSGGSATQVVIIAQLVFRGENAGLFRGALGAAGSGSASGFFRKYAEPQPAAIQLRAVLIMSVFKAQITITVRQFRA